MSILPEFAYFLGESGCILWFADFFGGKIVLSVQGNGVIHGGNALTSQDALVRTQSHLKIHHRAGGARQNDLLNSIRVSVD
jgi:hypothetical protein